MNFHFVLSVVYVICKKKESLKSFAKQGLAKMFDFANFTLIYKIYFLEHFSSNLKRTFNMNKIMLRGKLVKSYTVILGLPARELIALSLVVG